VKKNARLENLRDKNYNKDLRSMMIRELKEEIVTEKVNQWRENEHKMSKKI